MMAASRRFDVVGLGQCSFDILGRLADFPQPDQKTELSELSFQGGGPVATALVTLARLGIHTSLISRVGDDEYGVKIADGLKAESVDCSQLTVDIGATSQVAFIAVDKEARRNIFWHRGSARPLTPDEVDADLIRGAKVLHLDGLQHQASLAAAKIARDQGVVTILDGGSVREGTLELLPCIDHLVVSEKFAEQLLPGASVNEKLARLLSFGAKAVTITLGEKGSWSQLPEEKPFHQPAFPVVAVDTTGCGDVFHGGYIYGLLRGWDIAATIRFAAACAALKTRQIGGRKAIPFYDEIKTYLDSINTIKQSVSYSKT